MFIFAFTHAYHPSNPNSYTSASNSKALHNNKGVFQRNYLRRNIKPENYRIDSSNEKLRKILSKLGITNHPLYGIWLETDGIDTALMFRLGAEDLIHSKSNFKFAGGYTISDFDKLYEDLENFKSDIEMEEKIFTNLKKDENVLHYLKSYSNYSKSYYENLTPETKSQIEFNPIDVSNFDVIKNNLHAKITKASDEIKKLRNDAIKYLDSYKMNV